MGVQSRFRPAILIMGVFLLAALLGMPSGGQAAHDLNRDCYVCHNIKGGAIWKDSYSIWSGKKIGMTPYSRPITCDICHTDYGQKFGATSVSKHPVRVIVLDNTLADNNAYGSSPAAIDCRDCHSGNGTAGTPNLNPDVSPLNYSGLSGNGVSDGYPNHDNTITGYTIVPAVWGAGNVVTGGTEPHLGSSYDPLAGYNKVPSNAPLTDYALCLSCHDGTAGRTNRRVDVKTKYGTGKGHYYKYGTPTGGANGMKMPCSDCHSSHNAANNSRLYVSPKGTTVVFSNAVTPSAADIRTICIDCHDDYNVGNTGNGAPLVRGVEPPVRRYGVAGHAGTDTQSCAQCHDPHDAPAGGTDCLTCHTTGGSAGVRYAYVDNLFKGVGSDNGVAKPAASGALNWSQHGGFTGNVSNFIYASPFNTKGTNDCFKCHGDRHNNTFALIDADNTDSGASAFTPVSSLSAGTTTVANANAFCLTCHDGNGAAADLRIGGQAPPNVAANWATAGHGRLASTTYAVTGNKGAELKCVECHEPHGSNHSKLLPADNTATGAFAMPAGKPGMTFRNGALLASQIDFTDYSSPLSGQGYGTTGDPGNQHAPSGASTGLCDACHRQAGQSNGGTDNVTNKAHTHEGIVGDLNQDAPSQMTFTKDCLECHNTHGAPTATPNIAMIDNAVNGFAVTFTSRTGANSFDPLEAGATPNVNSVCVVCHQNSTENPSLNVGHNYRTSTVNPDHNEDSDCRSCHSHGNAANAAKFGFPQAACNSCHGASSDTAGMPAAGDNATYHADANPVIGTRAGDNTAHKIHVNYLVNKRAVSRANACYVCHKGGGAQETGHPGNPTNTSFKSGTQPTAVPYLQVALDNGGTGSILNVWNGAGTGPSYSGTPGVAADNTNGWKTCGNTSCHYALSPSWSGKQQITQPPGTMTVSTPDALPAAGNLNGGSVNNVVDKIRLQTNATGLVTDNQIKVRLKAGSTALNGTDIAKVAFWDDVNNDNVLNAGDTQIGGNAVFNATDNGYAVSGISYSVPASTTKQLLVVVDLAAGAVNGRTMTFSTVNGDITASYGAITAWTTFDSSQFTVSAPGTLTVSTPDALPAAGPVMVGSGNNVVDKINLVASGGFAAVTGLKVKELGTALNASDIANVTFWRDVNANGTLEPGTDTILGGAATFNAADNTYAVTGLSLNVTSGATERILVVDNVAAGATVSRTIQTQVVDNTYVTLSAGTVAGTFPIAASSVQTISSGGQLTVTTPDALPAAGDIRGASDNNVVDKITLTAATANVVVSGLWVKELGTSLDVTDIASVSFVDNTGGANTVLGTATFNAADNTYRLTGLGLTVAVGTPRTILVTANIANGATAARTVQTQVNDGYVQLSTGTVNTITPFSSTVQTIRALTAVIVTDTAGSTTPVNATSLSASGTHQFFATATYSNAALNQNVTTSSAWSRAGTATGSTVGASTGLYTAGTTAGTDNVTAAYRGQSDNTSVTVTTTVAFPATTYIVSINSGTALGWGNTNMTSGTAKTTQNDNTLLLKTAGGATNTYYGATVTGLRNAYNAIWNTALAAGSNTTITGVTFNIYIRKGSATDNVQLLLMYFNPANGAATTIYNSGEFVPSGTVGTTSLVTHASPAISVPVPDGVKLGIKVNFRQGSTTAMRVYVETATAGQATQFTLNGTNATGVAPAPPRSTGDTTAIACNSCHQFGPDDATAGYKDSNQYYYALPGAHARHGVSLIAGVNPVADNALNTCTICHPSTANAYGSDHMSGAVNLRTGSVGTRTAGPAYADDGTYDNATRTCSNVYCHAGRPTPQATGKSWGYGSTAVCGQCHAVTPPFGKHAIHNNGNVNTTPSNASTAGNYDFSCYYCHPSGAAHVNYPVSAVQAAQVAFSGTLGAQTLSGTYTAGGTTAAWDNVASQGLSWTNGSCATYCHTNGQGGAALVTPTWNHTGFPTATCVGCHDTRGAATTLSTRHRKHTDNTAATGYNFSCDECHALTVANDSWTTLHATTGRINHVDGNLTVQFGTTLRATAVAISGTYTQGVDNCANTYCHSDGSSVKNGGSIQANSALWTTAGPLACNACHGVGGPASGSPNYATSGSRRNSHPKHVAFTCQTCHAQTTTTGNTITAADNHVNGVYNVSGTGFTYAFNATTGSTCAFTGGCHTGTVTWGTPLANGCFDCHAGTEQAQKPQPAAGTPNPVSFAEYTTAGHGRTGTGYPVSNNPAAGKWDNTNKTGCYTSDTPNGCHDSTSAHIPPSATDPYRLGTANYDNGTNGGICLTCHGAGGAALSKPIQTHAYGITGTAHATWGNTPWKCVDCHDPHGDTNIDMIRSAINIPQATPDASAGSDPYGSPRRTTGLTNVTFNDNTGYDATNTRATYARADNSGICNVCHRQTTAYSNVAGGGLDNVGTHAARTGRCTGCHTHDTGFKGSGDCEACHGGVQGPRRTITTEFGLASHHSQNVNASTVTKLTCAACHMEANADGSMNNAYHNVGASSPYPIDLVVYSTYPTRGTPVSLTNLSDNLLKANAHCLSCHNATNAAATPFSAQGDTRTPTTYSWDGRAVDTKYSNAGTTPFGKYSSTTYNVVPADLISKAYSPHGNVANNHGGHKSDNTAWADRTGQASGTTARAGTTNVACLDCHNSHGSGISAGTTYTSPAAAYAKATGTPGNGGLLKDTATYTPTASVTAGNLYSAQADFCFDCHLGDDATAPKKYTNFLGASAQIVDGYYDGGRWGTTATWSSSFAYKNAAMKGGHFGRSTTSSSGAAITMKTTPGESILGLCTKCHDPHGVAGSTGDNVYMVPALKGTWMHSPYKEDRPGDRVGGSYIDPSTVTPANNSNYADIIAPRQNPRFEQSQPYIVGGGYGSGIAASTWGKSGTGYNGYFIDENTFGNSQMNATTTRPATPTVTYISQTDTQFGGLCLQCHPKTGIGTLSQDNGRPSYTFSWKTSNKTVSTGANTVVTVHRTVKGWDTVATAADFFKFYHSLQHVMNTTTGGNSAIRIISSYSTAPGGYRWSVNAGTTFHAASWNAATDANFGGGTNNYGGQQNTGFTQSTFHQFPCSKCHTAHVGRHPRLMKTNCLDVGTDNTALTARNKHGSTSAAYAGTGYVFGGSIADRNSGGTGYSPNERPMHCHNQKSENKPGGGGWNVLTGWP